jgi:hypothetical protein
LGLRVGLPDVRGAASRAEDREVVLAFVGDSAGGGVLDVGAVLVEREIKLLGQAPEFGIDAPGIEVGIERGRGEPFALAVLARVRDDDSPFIGEPWTLGRPALW